jgi:8-oxo-dGTP pyrophosphatase MutT (NUDIX family)
LNESRIESEELKFQGRVIRVNVEHVRLPNHSTAALEIIHHPGGAAVLALDEQQRICLLHQFRHAAGGYIWELPAGKIDNREPHFDTAVRELREEAGCAATHWQYLGSFFSSPGVFTEVIHLYLARGLTHVGDAPEEHEVFEIKWLPVPEVMVMAGNGVIRDGKTLVALLLAQPHLVDA